MHAAVHTLLIFRWCEDELGDVTMVERQSGRTTRTNVRQAEEAPGPGTIWRMDP